MAGTTTGPATADRAFRFLAVVEKGLPPGASVALVRPGHRSEREDSTAYMIAVGQLPHQNVLPAGAIDGLLREAPEFVASFEGEFDHPRYTVVRRMEYGFLYRRIP